MTSPFKFDGTISLGNIILILTLIMSVTAAWIANRERTLDNQAAIIDLRTAIHEMDLRIRAVEKDALTR
jgi:hypothetical protein